MINPTVMKKSHLLPWILEGKDEYVSGQTKKRLETPIKKGTKTKREKGGPCLVLCEKGWHGIAPGCLHNRSNVATNQGISGISVAMFEKQVGPTDSDTVVILGWEIEGADNPGKALSQFLSSESNPETRAGKRRPRANTINGHGTTQLWRLW